MPPFGLCGPSYTSESPNVDAESCVNWYPENVESASANTPIAMYPCPGIKPFSAVAGSGVRGLERFNDRTFAVGANFAEILSDGTAVGYAFLPVDNNPVTMAANNANQLIICAGGQLWLFPLAGGTIVYTPTSETISQIQIQDNSDPTVKDYYIGLTAIEPWTAGTTLTFAGVGTLSFLNGISAPIIDGSGYGVHLQLPRSLTLGYQQSISSIAMVQGSTQNASGSASIGGTFAISVPNNASGTTPYKTGAGFGFAIPTGATILGIVASFNRDVSNAALDANTNNIIMYKAGVQVGTSKGPGGAWNTVPSNESYGNSSDLWGAAWTPADINDPGFGFGIQVDYNNNGPGSYVLHGLSYSVTIYYALQDATITLTSSCLFAAPEPVALSGLTHATGLNGFTGPVASPSGSTFQLINVPGPIYNGADSGTVTGELINYGPTADTGTVTGNVITYTTNPIQVAIGQGPFASVQFSDGYFLALVSESQNFQISALEDGTSWDPADTFEILRYADNVLAMIVDHNNVWFLGPKQSLVYYNSTDPLVPFQPIDGAFLENGIAAPSSLCKLDNSIFWIGADERGQGIAWRADGYSPERVSNHAIENIWRKYPTITDAIAYSYQDNGHTFWVIWFPAANATWVYDAATGQWHQRTWFNNGVANAHRSRCHSFSFGKHLVGDTQTGAIFEMSIELLSDVISGVTYPIQRVRRAPHISKEQEWHTFSQLQVYLEPGLSGTVPDPQISLRWSNDGGHTWSSYYAVSAGALGEYTKRCVWRRLGRARDRVFEITCTDAYPWRIVNAYVQAK